MVYRFYLGARNGIPRALTGERVRVTDFCRDRNRLQLESNIFGQGALTLMNRTSLKMTLMLAATLAASIGCTTKNYVREQTTPLINKTNELDDLTAKNSKDIKDVDQRAQAGIQAVQARAAEVDQKALAA